VRPSEIIDVGSTTGVPIAVAISFACAAAAGLAYVTFASVRARRRELAILRALGCTGGQLRRSVLVQSIATMVGALVIGLPIGVVVGRLLWRAFAEQLGVLPDPASPWWAVGLAVVAGLVVAVVAALLLTWKINRLRPAEVFRSE
jgi:ABC-type antimicrobial peptide transport system permease subunit